MKTFAGRFIISAPRIAMALLIAAPMAYADDSAPATTAKKTASAKPPTQLPKYKVKKTKKVQIDFENPAEAGTHVTTVEGRTALPLETAMADQKKAESDAGLSKKKIPTRLPEKNPGKFVSRSESYGPSIVIRQESPTTKHTLTVEVISAQAKPVDSPSDVYETVAPAPTPHVLRPVPLSELIALSPTPTPKPQPQPTPIIAVVAPTPPPVVQKQTQRLQAVFATPTPFATPAPTATPKALSAFLPLPAPTPRTSENPYLTPAPRPTPIIVVAPSAKVAVAPSPSPTPIANPTPQAQAAAPTPTPAPLAMEKAFVGPIAPATPAPSATPKAEAAHDEPAKIEAAPIEQSEETNRIYLRASYLDAQYSNLESDLQNGATTMGVGVARTRGDFEGRVLLEVGHGMDQAVVPQNTRMFALRADINYAFLNSIVTPIAGAGLGYSYFNVFSVRSNDGVNETIRVNDQTSALTFTPAIGLRLNLPSRYTLDITAEYLVLVSGGDTSSLGGLAGALSFGIPF